MSHDEEPSNIHAQYTHTHIRIRIRRGRITLYVPHLFEHTLSKLDEILEREGSSVSEWFRDQAEAYVNLHWPGNPQQQISRFLKEDARFYVAPGKCFFRHCGRPAVALASFEGEGLYRVCKVHEDLINHPRGRHGYPGWKVTRQLGDHL